jgi:thiamine kinase
VTPEQVAAEVLTVEASALTATRIKGGLTNESWCVEGADVQVVVRISTADEHALQLNRYSETQVLSLVQAAGIGAEVLLCAPERRLLVTRKLDAQTLTLEALHDATCLSSLALLLQRLHALDAPASVQHTDLRTVLQGYWRSLQAQGLTQESDTGAHAMSIAEESVNTGQSCLCHNDVHHLNLMSDGSRLWLLDWEYAGVGDPLFDLASVCCYHRYSPQQIAQLLQAYRGQIQDAEWQRLQRMCWLFDYIKELWLAVRQLDDTVSFTSPLAGEFARSAGEGQMPSEAPLPSP